MLFRMILTVVMTAALSSLCSAFDTGSLDPSDFLGIPVIPESSKITASPVFQDILDTPAIRSALAVKSLLNGVARAGNRLVSVGERGHILYSDDQGKSWTQASVPVNVLLTAVHFPSAKDGWAVGQDGIVLHSSDGGVTWAKQFDGRAAAQVMQSYYTEHPAPNMTDIVKRFLDEGPDKPFLSVWFENETTGFIVGSFNLIFRTTDGGKSWVPWYHQVDNPNQYHLFAIRQVAQDLYISGERGLFLKLDRKADRFRAVKLPYNGTLFGLTGKSGALATFGLRGNLFISRDGGGNWQKVESGVGTPLTDGAVTEDGRIVVVSAVGQVIVSSDDGASFKLASVQPKPASAVLALGNDKLVLCGIAGANVVPFK